jgi:hypothetical protein
MARDLVFIAGGSRYRVKDWVFIAGGNRYRIKEAIFIAGGSRYKFYSNISAALVSQSASNAGSTPTITCTHQIKSDGWYYTTAPGGVLTARFQWKTSSNPASEYQVLATYVSGSYVTGTFGSWIAITGDPFWNVNRTTIGTTTGQMTIQIREASSGIVLAGPTTMNSSAQKVS